MYIYIFINVVYFTFTTLNAVSTTHKIEFYIKILKWILESDVDFMKKISLSHYYYHLLKLSMGMLLSFFSSSLRNEAFLIVGGNSS